MLFATVSLKSHDQLRLADMFGIKEKDLPVIALMHPHPDKIEKYILND